MNIPNYNAQIAAQLANAAPVQRREATQQQGAQAPAQKPGRREAPMPRFQVDDQVTLSTSAARTSTPQAAVPSSANQTDANSVARPKRPGSLVDIKA